MSYQHDVPWPSASQPSSATSSDARSPLTHSYFPPHLDGHTLTPNQTSQYAPATASSSGFHIVQGSELPPRSSRDISGASSPPSPNNSSAYPRSRKNTSMGMSMAGSSASLGSPLPRTQSGSLPLSSNSTVIKSKPATFVKPEEVWREILKTAYGRDKAMKIIQYSMRIFVLLHSRSRWLLRTPRVNELVRRMNIAIGHLSITRKNLILFNWLTPLMHILSPSDTSIPFSSSPIPPSSSQSHPSSGSIATLSSPTILHRFLHAPPPVLLDLMNALADDVATFWRLGLVGRRVGERAARAADWFWFASTLAGLVEVGAERSMVRGMLRELEGRIYDAEMDKSTDLGKIDAHEKELTKLRAQFGWLQVTRVKLLMDLIFVSYDLFKFKRAKDSAKAATGLLSAFLSSYKMYDSQRNEILKSNEA